jgi:hypothetical protein
MIPKDIGFLFLVACCTFAKSMTMIELAGQQSGGVGQRWNPVCPSGDSLLHSNAATDDNKPLDTTAPAITPTSMHTRQEKGIPVRSRREGIDHVSALP